jgi:TIR domain
MSKIFISHASEDKEEVALPLAELLKRRGLDVWLDQWELALGDGLRRSIENALSQASFGVVILSPAYSRKVWPMRELDGLFSMETLERKLILPVLHNMRHDEIRRHWPMLSDRLSCSTDRGLAVVADQIAAAVHKSTHAGDRQPPPDAVLAEYRRRMLSAADRHDLRQLLYELEDFLRQYPGHPQARILQDQITAALRHEERPTLAPAPIGAAAPPRGLRAVIVGLLAFGALLYLLYRLLQALFG